MPIHKNDTRERVERQDKEIFFHLVWNLRFIFISNRVSTLSSIGLFVFLWTKIVQTHYYINIVIIISSPLPSILIRCDSFDFPCRLIFFQKKRLVWIDGWLNESVKSCHSLPGNCNNSKNRDKDMRTVYI